MYHIIKTLYFFSKLSKISLLSKICTIKHRIVANVCFVFHIRQVAALHERARAHVSYRIHIAYSRIVRETWSSTSVDTSANRLQQIRLRATDNVGNIYQARFTLLFANYSQQFVNYVSNTEEHRFRTISSIIYRWIPSSKWTPSSKNLVRKFKTYLNIK